MADTDYSETLQRALGGDATALGELLWLRYDQLEAHIAWLIPRELKSQISADDILQETLTAAWQNFAAFAPQENTDLSAWLRTIARRKLIDRIRTATRKKRGGNRRAVEANVSVNGDLVDLLDYVSNGEQGPSSIAAGAEAEADLQEALGKLPPRQRTAMESRYLQGLSAEIVATQMNCTVGAVHMLTSRAIEKLRDLMGRESRYFTIK